MFRIILIFAVSIFQIKRAEAQFIVYYYLYLFKPIIAVRFPAFFARFMWCHDVFYYEFL